MSKVMWKRTKLKTDRPQKAKEEKKVIKQVSKTLEKNGLISMVRTFFLAIGILLSLFFLMQALFVSGVFDIKKFEVYGIEQLSEQDVEGNLEKFKDRNIFLQNVGEVEQSISSSSIFLQNIYVEKAFPDTLRIYVVERFPEMVLINFQGAFLVDQDNVVVKVLSKTGGYDIKPEQIAVILGYGDINSKLVNDRILADVPEDERAEYDLNSVSIEERQNLLNVEKTEIEVTINELFDQNSKGVSTTEFANLSRFYMYSDKNYEVGQKISPQLKNVTREIISYFRSKEDLIPSTILWEDDFSIVVETENQKRFLFTERRDIVEQTQDLELALEHLALRGEDYTEITLRATDGEVVGIK
jgi:hypothetical protein